MSRVAGICAGRLAELRSRGLLRRPPTLSGRSGVRVELDGRELISFASNDYLGLSCDVRLAEAAADAAAGWGAGAASSRLVSGTFGIHAELEAALADFEGRQACLVFPTGYAANLGTIAALVGDGDAVVVDRLSHASIVDGCRLCGARLFVYKHCDPGSLDRVLRRARSYRNVLVVTDTVFSMDGDVAPLADLVEVCRRHGALLMADEAHATGVLGESGRGAAEEQGVCGEVDVLMGTLSKALGCQGGFVCGPRALRDLLVNVARSFVYTTALAPPVCAAALRALSIVPAESDRRRRLLELSDFFRKEARRLGFDTLGSTTQIVPLVVGDAAKAVELSSHLRSRGLLVPPIRPPTVPKGTSRLRVSLTAAHTETHVERLLSALAEWRRRA